MKIYKCVDCCEHGRQPCVLIIDDDCDEPDTCHLGYGASWKEAKE